MSAIHLVKRISLHNSKIYPFEDKDVPNGFLYVVYVYIGSTQTSKEQPKKCVLMYFDDGFGAGKVRYTHTHTHTQGIPDISIFHTTDGV